MAGITPLAIRRAAMDLLARREHAQQELLEKLTQKFSRKIAESALDLSVDSLDDGFSSDESVPERISSEFSPHSTAEESHDSTLTIDLNSLIIKEIRILFREGLQSDERFVESFINGRRSKGKGPRVVRQQLKTKGVDEDLVNRYLVDNDPIWFELAELTYTKKFGSLPPLSYEDKVKRQRFMLYRGFLYEQFSGLIEG